ncbi:PAS domain-containing protein [Parvularcula sp. ZS-1/3]|uniref:PAS domain-containing protein n=1 Tax=Parvularcula mediterranea TaxID=2732508 RepID=A0A7Y3W5F3_9PROT|nr:PAS domain-containing protein [Parvularcula mediterranea]NNU16237.1 PAS domain-containing protein [Parvularcula mediterranea]
MLPKRLRSFIEDADIPLSLADAQTPDMPLVLVNAAFERLTGYLSEEVVGQNCRFLQGNTDQPEARSEVRALLSGRADGQVVLKNYRKNGERFDNLLFLFPIEIGGKLAYFLGSQFEATGEDTLSDSAARGGYLKAHLATLQTDTRILKAQTRRTTSESIAIAARTLVTLSTTRGAR